MGRVTLAQVLKHLPVAPPGSIWTTHPKQRELDLWDKSYHLIVKVSAQRSDDFYVTGYGEPRRLYSFHTLHDEVLTRMAIWRMGVG